MFPAELPFRHIRRARSSVLPTESAARYRSVAALFLYLDRVLEASFVGKSLSGVWRLGREWGKGSLFVEKLWLPLIGPMASLAFAPYGVKPGPETIIGISLALACVFPTELVFLAIAGSLSVVLWSRAKERRRTPVDRDFISATGEVTSRLGISGVWNNSCLDHGVRLLSRRNVCVGAARG